MSTNGCCRGLPASVCAARPYGCSDSPPEGFPGDKMPDSNDLRIEAALNAEVFWRGARVRDRIMGGPEHARKVIAIALAAASSIESLSTPQPNADEGDGK